jgi:hypothetical protein
MHDASLALRTDMLAKSIRVAKQPHARPVTLKLYDKRHLRRRLLRKASRRADLSPFTTRRPAPVSQVILAKGWIPAKNKL